MTANISIRFENEFGDVTEVSKSLLSTEMYHVFMAIRETLLGCGYAQQTVDEYFPLEDK